MESTLDSAWTAERITRLRQQIGLSRTQMAQKLGVCRQAVRLWETGLRSPKGLAKRALQELEEEQIISTDK